MRAVLQRVREASVRVPATGGEPSPASRALDASPDAAQERVLARIGRGLLVLVGFAGTERPDDLEWMADKIVELRIFPREDLPDAPPSAPRDHGGCEPEGAAPDCARPAASLSRERLEFDRSVLDMGGEILVVSQFTLLASVRKGRRPDFVQAASAASARPLYEDFVRRLGARSDRVQEGLFGAEMRVALVNDGPVTIILDR